jgi:hypothetical protein
MTVATSVQAKEPELQTSEVEIISFVNEIGCELSYKISDLADIIATSDTLDDDDEAIRLIYEFEEAFPLELGPDEPAVAILLPDDDYFNVIFIQETEDGDILTLRILSEGGWLECLAEPGDEELLGLAGMIAFIQHLDEVSR